MANDYERASMSAETKDFILTYYMSCKYINIYLDWISDKLHVSRVREKSISQGKMRSYHSDLETYRREM